MHLAVAFGGDRGAVDGGYGAVIGEAVRRRGTADRGVEASRYLVDQLVQPLHTYRAPLDALNGRGRPVPDTGRGECAVSKRGRCVAGDRGVGDDRQAGGRIGLGGVIVGQYPAGAAGTVAIGPGGGGKGGVGGRVVQTAASEAPGYWQA